MALSKFSLRQTFICPLFGNPKDLTDFQLPTYEEVMRCCSFERRKLGVDLGGNKEPPFSIIADNVAKKIAILYTKASIPTVSHARIVQMINAYHKKCREVKKGLYSAHRSPALKKRSDDFKTSACRLFDIAACKCVDFESCLCPKERKIPKKEQAFLLDQRSARVGRIGAVDIPETKRLINRCRRREAIIKQTNKKLRVSENHPSSSRFDCEDCEESRSDTSDSDIDILHSPDGKSSVSTTQMRLRLPETALTSQRYGVSDRATAMLVTSVLKDVGLITPESQNLVTDKSKIRREKNMVRRELKLKDHENVIAPKALYFDGRKDETYIQVKRGDKINRHIIREEHISVLSEPDSKYLTHVVPKSGTAVDIEDSIYEGVMKEGGFEELFLVGCDGTAVNTGPKGGIIRCLEDKLGRSLQWAICLLHFNELPFRSLFQTIDGVTSGPKSFSGQIGSKLNGCENLPVVKFVPISCELPDISFEDLSKDQKYLLEISKAIKAGNCPPNLTLVDPGCINHARWLTCANRILRLYISTARPTAKLKDIVKYLLTVYVPMWFKIRNNNSLDKGTRLLFETIRLTRYLPSKYLSVVDATISRNAYFALPENILVSMMTDQRREIRLDALTKILQARNVTGIASKPAKNRTLPDIDFNAVDYSKMINWSSVQIISPPVLKNVTDQTLKEILLSDTVFENWEFSKYPCHTLAVERMVKLVTEASIKVCGSDARDGFIRCTLLSRRRNPQFDNKGQYSI